MISRTQHINLCSASYTNKLRQCPYITVLSIFCLFFWQLQQYAVSLGTTPKKRGNILLFSQAWKFTVSLHFFVTPPRQHFTSSSEVLSKPSPHLSQALEIEVADTDVLTFVFFRCRGVSSGNGVHSAFQSRFR